VSIIIAEFYPLNLHVFVMSTFVSVGRVANQLSSSFAFWEAGQIKGVFF